MSDRAALGVFAVEDTSVQITWRMLPAGATGISAGDSLVDVAGRPSPGAATLANLRPSTEYDLILHEGVRHDVVARFRTLSPPPGELLTRFATISDLHIGERGFGKLPKFQEDESVPRDETFAIRCSRAAVADATAWGASCLVAKGDLTWSGRDWQWQVVADLFSEASVPVHATLGNHDVGSRGVDGRAALARRGIIVAAEPVAVDLPGLRLVVAHTAEIDHERGVMTRNQRARVTALLRDGRLPGFLTMHHYVDPLPFPSRYPVGIPRRQGAPLLREVATANPRTFISFGHTHRNRRKVAHGVPVTEVGSTKDYPGVWAGYAVHEGGIRQVVRRVSDPECMRWTERNRLVLAGFWGRWSPGRLTWRCFTHPWP